MSGTYYSSVRQSRTLFLVMVLIFLGLGSLVSGLNYVLMGVSLPVATLLGTIASLVPLFILLWYFLWLDSSEVESRLNFYLAFGWGAIGSTGWALAINSIGLSTLGETLGMALVAPITEETFKAFFLVALYLWQRVHFDGVLDGIVYAGFIGVGFAFVENITYFVAAYSGTSLVTGEATDGGAGSLLVTFVARGVFSPFAHPLFTAAVGIGLGLAVTRKSKLARITLGLSGLLVAIGLHALWNGSLAVLSVGATAIIYFCFFVPLFAAYITFSFRAKTRTEAAQAEALRQLSLFGMLPPASSWLSSSSSRKEVVREAKKVLPPAAARAVKQYQHEAVRFAHFHLRVQAGVGPEDPRPHAYESARRLRTLTGQFPPVPAKFL